ncbi:hypothetical protein KAJ27_12605 [bacterium]|nr:hypothetical protein [bacterium]
MLTFILFILITLVDAVVLFLLVPRFIGDAVHRQAPDFPESLMHSGIANALGWLGGMMLSAPYLGYAYFVYLFWNKLGLNKLAVIFCWTIMAVCDYCATMALLSVLVSLFS